MALVAVVLSAFAGASVAAVTAAGKPAHHNETQTSAVAPGPVPTSSAPVQPIPGEKLLAAAGYLGISMTQLNAELREGKTLAQIANATPGRSEAGLIKALVEKRREQLARAAAALPKRVAAAVRKKGGPASSNAGLREVARAYLGISAAQLAKDLRAGETLGDIAEATPGHSREGLMKALFAARQHQLDTAVQSGRLSEAARRVRLAHAQRRVERVIARTKRRPHSHAAH